MSASNSLLRISTRMGRLAILDVGEDDTVLCWPSLFSDHRLYTHVTLMLRRMGWRVISIDGPGFGASDAPARDATTEDYAKAVIDLLDALRIDSAFFAGCSWGGQIAAHVAVQAPSRIRGVVMMNTPLGSSFSGHLFEVVGTRWFGSSSFWGNGVARSMFSKETRQKFPERVSEFVSAFSSFDRTEAATTVRSVLNRFPGLAEVLPAVEIPIHILMGAEDKLYPVERMRPLAELARQAEIKVVPSCGHLLPIEAPEAMVSSLNQLRTPRTGNESHANP